MKALVNKELKSLFCSIYLIVQVVFPILIASYILTACSASSKNEKEYELSQYTKNLIGELEESVKIIFEVNGTQFDSFISALQKNKTKAIIKKQEGDSKLILSRDNRSLEIELSTPNLEYTFTKQLKILLQHNAKDIAFIEGHGELLQVELLDAEELLAQEYNVHRGEIRDRVGGLDNFAAIIIAGPKKIFNEKEKYILDQYVMQGGKIMWLLDGMYLSEEHLKTQGWSASIKNETNLDNLLFNYGARVKPQLIQDHRCSNIQLISNKLGDISTVPNIYAPLLDLSLMQNKITANLSSLALRFASPIDTATNMLAVKKEIILHSSSNTFLVDPPERIEFYSEEKTIEYFNNSQVPIALTLEAEFQSFYPNPNQLSADKHLDRSLHNKMIVVGSSSIIRNELQGQHDATQTLPMGYNRADNTLANNRDFILNAINWLTEDKALLDLKDISKADK